VLAIHFGDETKRAEFLPAGEMGPGDYEPDENDAASGD